MNHRKKKTHSNKYKEGKKLLARMYMKKEYEIIGCIEVQNKTKEEFFCDFIEFIESKGWKFAGSINEIQSEDNDNWQMKMNDPIKARKLSVEEIQEVADLIKYQVNGRNIGLSKKVVEIYDGVVCPIEKLLPNIIKRFGGEKDDLTLSSIIEKDMERELLEYGVLCDKSDS